jgi:hypothetical protein
MVPHISPLISGLRRLGPDPWTLCLLPEGHSLVLRLGLTKVNPCSSMEESLLVDPGLSAVPWPAGKLSNVLVPLASPLLRLSEFIAVATCDLACT